MNMNAIKNEQDECIQSGRNPGGRGGGKKGGSRPKVMSGNNAANSSRRGTLSTRTVEKINREGARQSINRSLGAFS